MRTRISRIRKRDGRIVEFKDDLKLSLNAVEVLKRRYLLKDEQGNVIESPSQMFERVATAIARAELNYGKSQEEVKEIERRFYLLMRNLEFLPNSPTLMNAGTELGQLAACFTAEQPILTPEGFKPIESIKVGDLVVTHKGRHQPVVQTMQRDVNEDIYKISVRKLLFPTLSVTGEHPILAVKRADVTCVRDRRLICRRNKKFCHAQRGRNKNECRYLSENITRPRWIRAKDLEEGDFVVISYDKIQRDAEHLIIKEILPDDQITVEKGYAKCSSKYNEGNAIPNGVNLDGDMLRLFGYWLSDGSLSFKDGKLRGIRFTFHEEAKLFYQNVLDIVKCKFGLKAKVEYLKGQKCIELRFHSTILAKLFAKLFGTSFDNKHLPLEIMCLPFEKQFDLAKGLFRGDGCFHNSQKQDIIFAEFSNELLAYQTWLIMIRLGYPFNITKMGLPKLGTTHPYRVSCAPSECENFALSLNKGSYRSRNRYSQYIRLGEFFLYPIDKIKREHFAGRVYNLEVEREHSYVANGVAVHNCFVLPVEDSMDSIFNAVKNAALIHQSGGGTGFSFSRLRPKGDVVKSTGGIASGPVSFMRVFDVATDVIKQGGKRRGANMGILNAEHPDILEFIRAKERGEFANFNTSVAVTDEFMQAVESNEKYDLINPRTNKSVRKINAREVFNEIVTYAWKTGDPGIIFLDEINRHNPISAIGKIEATNPCGEQPLLPYDSCNLGSINVSKFVKDSEIDWERLREVIWLCTRFLDDVIDVNRYPLPEIEHMTKANRKIGLGVMGFAELLITLGIPYDSKDALSVGEKLMQFITNEARQCSIKLGLERGSFSNFEFSIWSSYDAMRNATVTTIAPTGTISIIGECSSGIEPIFAVAFVRNVMGGMLEINKLFEEIAKEREFYSKELITAIAKCGSVQDIDSIPEDIKRTFVTALDISPEWHVRMQAAFQKYTDNATSKTVNLPSDATWGDVKKIFLLAYKLKCKGITVYRYGSKEQVLSLDIPKLMLEEYVCADSEYTGECRICSV